MLFCNQFIIFTVTKFKKTLAGNFNVIESTRVFSQNVWVKEPARVQLFNHGARSDAY